MITRRRRKKIRYIWADIVEGWEHDTDDVE
jgi:hypothetical protein